jgi:hypothetical protein
MGNQHQAAQSGTKGDPSDDAPEGRAAVNEF